MRLPLTCLFLALTLPLVGCGGSSLPARLQEVAVDENLAAFPYKDRWISIYPPTDPWVRALGGSGGPMQEIRIDDQITQQTVLFTVQSIGTAVLDSHSPLPEFEIWSGAGGGMYTRCRYQWIEAEARYCCLQIDEFIQAEPEDSGTVRMPGSDQVFRFDHSRQSACVQ
jgi:hypothetical protein